MAKGGNFTQRVDIIDSYDPRVTGRAAAKGTLFRFIPAIGDPELLIKADDGFTTNWISLAGGSSLPITVAQAGTTADINLASAPANIDGVALNNGDVVLVKNQAVPAENGVYDFNGAGLPMTRNAEWAAAGDFIPGRQVFVDAGTANIDTLWADADYVTVLGIDPVTFVKVSSSVVVGDPNTLAYFDNVGNLTDNTEAKFDETLNAMAFGINTGGNITANGNGSLAHGNVNAGGNLTAAAAGAHAQGYADNGTINANGNGAFANGYASSIGVVGANGNGSTAFGIASSAGLIQANGSGSLAFGNASNDASISSLLDGGMAFGLVTGASTVLSSINHGALAHGRAESGSVITAANYGSHVHGYATNAAQMTAGIGATAHGFVSEGLIRAPGNGSMARGIVSDAGSEIAALGVGSFASGEANSGGVMTALSNSAHVIGTASGANSVIRASFASFAGGYAGSGGIIEIGSSFPQPRIANLVFGIAEDQGTLGVPGINGQNATGSIVTGQVVNVGSLITSLGRGQAVHGAASASAIIRAFELAHGSFVHGSADNGSLLETRGLGSHASGYLLSSGQIRAVGNGSFAQGSVTTSGQLVASIEADFVHGTAKDNNSLIQASGGASFALGLVLTAGKILSQNTSSFAIGFVDTDAIMTASGPASVTMGRALNSGQHNATGTASFALGYADGGRINAAGVGSLAQGYAQNDNAIVACSGNGCNAHGYAEAGPASEQALILAIGSGSHAHGHLQNTGGAGGISIFAAGIGSTVFGSVVGNNGRIRTDAEGSLVFGKSINGADILNSLGAVGSLVFGYASSNLTAISADGAGALCGGVQTDPGAIPKNARGIASLSMGGSIDAVGDYSAVFGFAHQDQRSFASFVIGRYATVGGTVAAWVDTEALFKAGNGTAVGAENNAYVLYKDGKIETTGAQRHRAVRSVNADTTLSERTDRSLFVDTATAAGNVTVTFPAGEDGLEYFVKDSGNNASVNNVLFAPTGGDVIEASANITNNRGTRHFQFFSGTWYVMNLP